MPTSSAAFLKLFGTFADSFGTQGAQLAQTAATAYVTNLPWFELLGVLATVALAIGIIILLGRLRWIGSRIDRYRHAILNADVSKAQTRHTWNDIERHFFAGSDSDLRIAVIEADKTLDIALRNSGVIGSNIGDRLKKIKPSQLPNLEDVWLAHKLRNQIAHDDQLALKRDVAERALTIYRAALESLGALDKSK